MRCGVALQRILREHGWTEGDAWACFTMDLSRPVVDHQLRLAAIYGAAVGIPDDTVVNDIVTAHRAAWERSTFTVDKWHAMAEGVPHDLRSTRPGVDG